MNARALRQPNPPDLGYSLGCKTMNRDHPIPSSPFVEPSSAFPSSFQNDEARSTVSESYDPRNWVIMHLTWGRTQGKHIFWLTESEKIFGDDLTRAGRYTRDEALRQEATGSRLLLAVPLDDAMRMSESPRLVRDCPANIKALLDASYSRAPRPGS